RHGATGIKTTTALTYLMLFVALLIALGFEFVNGFHDTANAVATVIYTHTLKPTPAVVWSGMWNLIGVLVSTGGVAFGIVALLPVELVINVGSGAGFAMVFSLLLSAMIWNVGTWYFGLPASSSHTLIGSIVGVGLANSLIAGSHTFGDGVNWAKVNDTLAALLLSPVIGFVCAGGLYLLMRLLVRAPELYREPPKDQPPSFWIRALLVLTCTGVSFAHGSNDGQKGMGLLMLILIGIIPGVYALNPGLSAAAVSQLHATSISASSVLDRLSAGKTLPPADASNGLNAFLKTSGRLSATTWAALATTNREITTDLDGKTSLNDVAPAQRGTVRSHIYQVSATISKLDKLKAFTNPDEDKALKAYRSQLDGATNFIPVWVKVAVALFLGFGTMIGWKRIVVTVGERIGKTHMTYSQGASAEIVAYATIEAATVSALPVSTTHILSSGVAGTMFASGSGLQTATVRNILLAWVLTLPVATFLGAMFFAFGFRIVSSFHT
ncbi:MAG: inorganic phosphate transporter, partial [Candidatus Eremiobacteraeota bacterium]|nr:inorganic phosphate transporter [Candidatus Eremiobacteraeota bacterium]